VAESLAAATRPYRVVLASRMRSQRSYRTSFRLDLLSTFLIGFVELAEVWVLFHAVGSIGGMELRHILLVFGLAEFAYCLADMVVGHCDELPHYLRAGTLDVFYLRPQPLLLQLITCDISLRRLARATVGLGAMVAAFVWNDIDWSVSAVTLVMISLVSGFVMFSSLFVSAGGLQFFLINGAEMTNAYVYGGRYAATQPAAVWNRPLWAIFGFFFPMAFTAYLPALILLGLPAPHGLPDWIGWLAPVLALWSATFAGLCWRWGVRHYQGGGG
jgi:ABC-2 type transport system permease protein